MRPKGDSTVYTVALASIVARVRRDALMQETAQHYPGYGFENHGGYPTRAHTEALYRLGPCPIHRFSSKPVHSSSRSRGQFLASIAAAVSSSLVVTRPGNAMTVDSRTGSLLPDLGEIEAAVPEDWSEVENPLLADNAEALLGRLDSKDDGIFYQEPRFVEHVDEQAVGLLQDYVTTVLVRENASRVLDLCASWTSHVDQNAVVQHLSLQRVAGLGMNAKELDAKELDANAFLTERTVQNLNVHSTLPYQDNSFDVVFCQLSIEYLTKPLEVCREIQRVLRPDGGTVHILFSNRLFLSKAVALWTGADDVDHVYAVASYLHESGLTDIRARDLSVRKGRRIVGDPLYVVIGTKAASSSSSSSSSSSNR